jgi:hypothetical protein
MLERNFEPFTTPIQLHLVAIVGSKPLRPYRRKAVAKHLLEEQTDDPLTSASRTDATPAAD